MSCSNRGWAPAFAWPGRACSCCCGSAGWPRFCSPPATSCSCRCWASTPVGRRGCAWRSGVVTAMYSSSGGIKAVVTTDAIQSITMLVGAIVTLAVITYRMGGIAAWWPSEWPEPLAGAQLGFRSKHAGLVRNSDALHHAVVRLHQWIGPDGDPAISCRLAISRRPAARLAVAQVTDVVVAGCCWH